MDPKEPKEEIPERKTPPEKVESGGADLGAPAGGFSVEVKD